MEKPVVSVVIPICKGGPLLEQTIHSVLVQTFRSFEIILVDNNATEDTRTIAHRFAESHPDRIRIIHEPEQGVCSARNAGILESLGDYIALLDDDDLMIPERLEKQLQAALNHPDASMIICGADYTDHSNGTILYPNIIGAPPRWETLQGYCRKLLLHINPNRETNSFWLALPSTMFFSKQKAVNAGLYDCRLNPNYGEDYEFSVRMYSQGRFHSIPVPLTIYHTNAPGSLSNRRDPRKLKFLYLQGHKFFYLLWEQFYRNTWKTKMLFRSIAAIHLQLAGRHFLLYRDGTKIGRKLLFRAWTYSPHKIEHLKDMIKSFFPKKFHPRFFWFEHQFSDPLPPEIDQTFVKSLFAFPPEWMT
ncbi:MAG: glycosyltransferase family 2 protein [Leptospirales bacterium]